MRRFRLMPKIAAAIVSATMIFTTAVPAFADTSTSKALTVNNNQVEFSTSLSLNMQTSADGVTKRIPEKTFNYSIEAGAPVSVSETNKLPIYAGIVTRGSDNKVTAPTISGTTIDSQTVTTNSASVTSKIDFSGITFTKPGIYRYNLTNNDKADSAYTGDGFGMTKYLDVYVTNNGNGGLAISSATLYNPKTSSKNTGFEYSYASTYVKFTKNVEGNQGDHNKAFDFTVNLSNITGLDTLDVNAGTASTGVTDPKSDSDTKEADNISTLSKGTDGSFTHTFKLKHQQYITIDNLPKGYNFSINEDKKALNADGYTVTIPTENTGLTVDASNAKATKSNVTNNLDFTVTNSKGGDVPTGVIFAVAPFAIGAVAIAAFVILKVRKAAKQ